MINKNTILKFSAIYLIIYLIMVALVTFVEASNESSSIKTFSDGLWYSIVTIASVGYGDKFPVTNLGKIIGSIFVLGSIFTLTILISRVSDLVSEMRENKKMGYNGTNFKNHFVLVGWDNFSKLILDVLTKDGENQVAVITENKDSIEHIHQSYKEDSVFVLLEPMNDVRTYEKANLKDAKVIFINRANDTDKLITLLSLKQHYGLTNFMVALDEANLKETFEAAGVKFVLSKNEIASKLIASFMFEPQVAELNTDLISSSESDDDYDTQQFIIIENNPYLNKTYNFAFDDLKAKYNTILLGISKKIDGEYKLFKLPQREIIIEKGDYLLMINNHSSTQKIEKLFKVKQGMN